jgi:SepF-like predicted cell division protein (DUF552 family)
MASALRKTIPTSRPFELQQQADSWLQNKVAQSQASPFTEKIEVNPYIARAILNNNPNNRKIKDSKVGQFADDMEHGRWQYNGENVIIAKTGELNDGQHRLSAIIKSGISVPMNISFGVSRSTRYTVDAGMARNAGDQLQIQGFAYARQTASIARVLLAWEQAKGQHLGRPNEISGVFVQEKARNDARLADAALWAGTASRRLIKFPVAAAGFCYYVFTKHNKEKGIEFMTRFRDGDNLETNSPIYVARYRMQTGQRISTTEKIEIMFRAYNLFLKGLTTTQIQVRKRLPKIGE